MSGRIALCLELRDIAKKHFRVVAERAQFRLRAIVLTAPARHRLRVRANRVADGVGIGMLLTAAALGHAVDGNTIRHGFGVVADIDAARIGDQRDADAIVGASVFLQEGVDDT